MNNFYLPRRGGQRANATLGKIASEEWGEWETGGPPTALFKGTRRETPLFDRSTDDRKSNERNTVWRKLTQW